MLPFFKKFFDYNEKELIRIKKIVDGINSLDDKTRVLNDNDFPKETQKLKGQVQSGEKTLNDMLPWSFALVREAARRVLNERHFDVQLIAGVALHEGKIAEQKTGEGKTLSATAALYLNALTGKGVHLVTVNDYLARRDAGWMGKVFHFLGMTTSAIISDKSFLFDHDFSDKEAQDWRIEHLKPVSRMEAYQADITYGINSEFGFDYLRDNMTHNPADIAQRGFHFAIIDEADSVLIDEARTPHIISAPYDEDVSKYYDYARIVKKLDKKDYLIDEKLRTVHLTETGIAHIESLMGISNVYEKDFEALFHIEASLKSETLFKKDKDYIVKDGEVIIVDEFTGRLLYGRRFSEGLHQAIEAKEGVSIQRQSKTLATVSLQNYFRMYKKLAGMTGTAATEAEEFKKIYNTDVLIIPTHRKMQRQDNPDMIYKKEHGKFFAVVEEIANNYKTGRPVLVGTTSIEKNEYLSQLLHKKGIPHELLNAKNHEREAFIISQAGKKGAVTVATNMAGRGVDILLGGNPPVPTSSRLRGASKSDDAEEQKQKQQWQEEHDEVVGLGGLYVIGTERHESRRIDNQLRGRSGRQGDPGETRFFVSLEDDLMRIFGGEQISKLMTFFNFPEDQPLSHSMVSKAIEQAQVKVEGFNFDIRKHLVDFDDVLNKQRSIVYELRKKILLQPEQDKKAFKETVFTVLYEEIEQLMNRYFFEDVVITDEHLDNFTKDLHFIIHFNERKIKELGQKYDRIALEQLIKKEVEKEFNEREKKFGTALWFDVIKTIFLTTIDRYWTDHLTAIEDLREGINLRGYAQLDPLVEYKNEAYSMFEQLMNGIDFEAVRRLFKVEIEAVPQPEKKDLSMQFKSASAIDPFNQRVKQESIQPSPQEIAQNQTPQQQAGFKIIPPGTKQKNIGRNDPCWCGARDSETGKAIKYKKCHYPN